MATGITGPNATRLRQVIEEHTVNGKVVALDEQQGEIVCRCHRQMAKALLENFQDVDASLDEELISLAKVFHRRNTFSGSSFSEPIGALVNHILLSHEVLIAMKDFKQHSDLSANSKEFSSLHASYC